MTLKLVLSVLSLLTFAAHSASPSPTHYSVASHQQFFNSIKALCGKAFAGKVIVDAPTTAPMTGPFVMHVRRCNDQQIQIPFHVGTDRSRTWLLTQTPSGLALKHDHRHQDGSPDQQTMYGGHTSDAGYPQVQSFPADPFSKALFVETGIPQSMTNVWQMYIYPERFSYRMVREGREFRVDFDLTKPITTPPAPWGYSDH